MVNIKNRMNMPKTVNHRARRVSRWQKRALKAWGWVGYIPNFRRRRG